MPRKTATPTNTTSVTPPRVKEIAETVVSKAMQEQARELEKHLMSIHDRLTALEQRK